MKPPRTYVICPACYRADLPEARPEGKPPTGLLLRPKPEGEAFTRQSRGLGRARGFKHKHVGVELPEEVRLELVRRCKAFLKRHG